MGRLYDTLVDLSHKHDQEILDGFQRYENAIAEILTPEQVDRYVDQIQATREVRVFDDMSPQEIADLPAGMAEIAAAVTADTNTNMENRRVVALLSQRGEYDIAPDYR